jgi:hypothetical protein
LKEPLLVLQQSGDKEISSLFSEIPAEPSHIRRSALMVLILWLQFSHPSLALKESLVEENVVQRVFKLVADTGLKLRCDVVTQKLSSLPSEGESQSCDCESSPLVYSEATLQLAITALVLLCDDPSSSPDCQLSVSRAHLSIIRTIPPLVASYLHATTSLSNDPKPLIAVAMLFYQVAHHLREKILPDYEHWVEVAIEGTGHWSNKSVRKYFALALRTLVPLAPLLLRSLQWKDSLQTRRSSTNTSHLVGEVFLSQYPLLSERYMGLSTDNPVALPLVDRTEMMRERISQLGQSIDGKVAQLVDLSRLLRPYQLKGPSSLCLSLSLMISHPPGIEWILQLWKSGLGGVLADEMGLGKVNLPPFHDLVSSIRCRQSKPSPRSH